jgi:uncharacterized membrane protein YfbV (UPF0208 family)
MTCALLAYVLSHLGMWWLGWDAHRRRSSPPDITQYTPLALRRSTRR